MAQCDFFSNGSSQREGPAMRIGAGCVAPILSVVTACPEVAADFAARLNAPIRETMYSGSCRQQRLLDSPAKDTTPDENARAQELSQCYQHQYVAPFRT